MDFDNTTDWVLFSTSHKIFVIFPFSFSYGKDGIYNLLRKTFTKKILRANLSIFYCVMKERNDSFGIC